MSLFSVFASYIATFAILGFLYRRYRRKLVGSLMPHLKAIDQALFTGPDGTPFSRHSFRYGVHDAARLCGCAGGVDYLFTRVDDLAKGTVQFHVEIASSGPVPEFLMVDLDGRCEATALLTDIFVKHERFFEAAWQSASPMNADADGGLKSIRGGETEDRN